MSKTKGRPRGISKRRLDRVENEIAPLLARGLTTREIANRLDISHAQAFQDCRLVRQNWDDQIPERLEIVRGELVAKHDALYKTCMEAYAAAPAPKWIELASKELECLGRLLGQAGPAINLHQHSHSVNVTAEAVSELFKPLDAAAYGAMVAAKPLPPAADAAELPVIDVAAESGSDEWSTAPAAAPMPQPADCDPRQAKPAPAAGTIKRVRHPLGRR